MNEHPEFCTCMGCRQTTGLKRSNIGSNGQADMQMPLSDMERAELNAYRAKAQRESDEYYQQMRGMMNHTQPMTVADMQKAVNVNLHARELPTVQGYPCNDRETHEFCNVDGSPVEPLSDPAQPIVKLIFRQAFYFLLVMLAVGVGLAVFL